MAKARKGGSKSKNISQKQRQVKIAGRGKNLKIKGRKSNKSGD